LAGDDLEERHEGLRLVRRELLSVPSAGALVMLLMHLSLQLAHEPHAGLWLAPRKLLSDFQVRLSSAKQNILARQRLWCCCCCCCQTKLKQPRVSAWLSRPQLQHIAQQHITFAALLLLLPLLLLLLQNAVTHRLLLMPAMPAGQALQWLANGPSQTELMMQWQVRSDAVQVRWLCVYNNCYYAEPCQAGCCTVCIVCVHRMAGSRAQTAMAMQWQVRGRVTCPCLCLSFFLHVSLVAARIVISVCRALSLGTN
jgi:hypothetical protein